MTTEAGEKSRRAFKYAMIEVKSAVRVYGQSKTAAALSEFCTRLSKIYRDKGMNIKADLFEKRAQDFAHISSQFSPHGLPEEPPQNFEN